MPRFTRAAQDICVATMALTGNVTKAALEAGVSRRAAYVRMSSDADFRQRMVLAKDEYYDRLLAEARRRAVDGVQEPLLRAGRAVATDTGHAATIRRYSDRLMLFMLRRADRQRPNEGEIL